METTAGGPEDPLVGRLLDERYALDEVVAHGGMATVYRATDTRLDRTVAVKVMARRYAADPDFVARFTREAKASARLSNAHVVAVYDYGTDRTSGLAYLVMELVVGRNFRQLLQERGPLPAARAVGLVEPVLQALAAAHTAGIVHRDIKPENVLLADDGQVKVADFGLARAVETSNLTATTGLILGTVAYLAPEQVVSGTADARTDVYASGILLWELLTGVPPHFADNPMSVAYKHVHEDVPPPSSLVSDIPLTLDALLVRATSREPSARPVDGGAFLAELRAVQSDLPPDVHGVRRAARHDTQVIPVTRPAAGSAPVTAPRSQRRRGLLAGVLVLILAGLALLAGLVLGGGRPLGTDAYTRAPGVLGLSEAAATAKLTAAGLTAGPTTMVFDEAIPAGNVRDQTPAPGVRMRKDAAVSLVVSKGPDRRTVPAVVGTSLAAATKALHAQGLATTPPTKVFSSSVDVGDVVKADPPAGTRLKPGAAVALVISKGIEQVTVPSTVNRSQRDAGKQLEDLGFRTTVTQAFSDTVPAGAVIAQDPAGGKAAKGSTVALTISKGPDIVTVPDVTGQPKDKAKQALEMLGLKVTLRALPGPGTVIGQTPGRGTKVKRGSTVTLYVF